MKMRLARWEVRNRGWTSEEGGGLWILSVYDQSIGVIWEGEGACLGCYVVLLSGYIV